MHLILFNFTDEPSIYGLIAIGFVIILFSSSIYLKKHKPKVNKVILTKAYISLLKDAFGADNIIEINVEHERVKFIVKDVKKADLKLLKGFSKEGIFVKGKEITMTFKENPKDIKKLLDEEVNYGKNV